MDKGLDLNFEDEIPSHQKNIYRKKILDFLREKKTWQNTHQVKRNVGCNYNTAERQLQYLTDNRKVEKLVIPFGKYREMELWRAK